MFSSQEGELLMGSREFFFHESRTSQTAIELSPHRDVTAPRLGMNSNKLRFERRYESVSNHCVTVKITTEYLRRNT